jgi:hypothetical protein
MTLDNEILPELRKHDAELLSISVEGVWCHAAFARDRHLHFPLFADFETQGRRREEIPRLSRKRGRLRARTICPLQRHFGGRMRIVFPHFPLTEVHPHAEIAAESAEFAGAAGLFWEMHDALFANQSRLSIPTIFLIAEELGLPEIAMRNALETGRYRNGVHCDFWTTYVAA